MTFEDVLKQYCLKIGQSWGNMSEDLTTEALERVASSYWDICRTTGCTWRKPTLVSLSAVTATTNLYQLSSILSLSAGEEVFNLSKVTWDGVPLALWDKEKLDSSSDYYNESGANDPVAYAFWEEWNSTDNEKRSYIGFYPFVAAANTTDCYISYFLRPAKPTSSNYTTIYPVFAGEWHEIIAELAALKYLRDQGSSRYSRIRMADVMTDISKMKNHYIGQISAVESGSDPLRNSRFRGARFYGASVYDE